jgi:hypothetical protein
MYSLRFLSAWIKRECGCLLPHQCVWNTAFQIAFRPELPSFPHVSMKFSLFYLWRSSGKLNRKLSKSIFSRRVISVYIVTRMNVTTDGFWIDDLIYWFLSYSAWLQFTTHYYTHISVHSHVFNSRYSVAASNDGRSPSSGFPNYPNYLLTATAHIDWIPAVL